MLHKTIYIHLAERMPQVLEWLGSIGLGCVSVFVLLSLFAQALISATHSVFLKPLKPAPLFQLQALGADLPKVFPTDLEGIRSLFKSISKRDDIVIHDVKWASEWRYA